MYNTIIFPYEIFDFFIEKRNIYNIFHCLHFLTKCNDRIFNDKNAPFVVQYP